jgi:hypothetical protein
MAIFKEIDCKVTITDGVNHVIFDPEEGKSIKVQVKPRRNKRTELSWKITSEDKKGKSEVRYLNIDNTEFFKQVNQKIIDKKAQLS